MSAPPDPTPSRTLARRDLLKLAPAGLAATALVPYPGLEASPLPRLLSEENRRQQAAL